MSALDAFRLDGKVAIVTGAGRGIGASIARTFADAGADIVLAARTKEQLDEVAADVRAAGREALVIPADVNENDVLEEIVARTVAEMGHLDIVVNNAGGTMPRPVFWRPWSSGASWLFRRKFERRGRGAGWRM